MKQQNLHLGDVAVGLALGIEPSPKLKLLSDRSGRSIGEVHNALARLRAARLLKPDGRMLEREPFLRFLRWGVPHAFPATIGPLTVGIATARIPNASDLTEPGEAEFVWPTATGVTRGQALSPPYRTAPAVLTRSPQLRTLLSLLDLVRVGGTREQAAAIDEIARRISAQPA
jgi:hypothetical protein